MNKIISLVLITIFSFNVYSQDVSGIDEIGRNNLNTITTAVPFLLISPDSRAGGMGDVGVATSADANSMHWNPAKYSFIDQDRFMSEFKDLRKPTHAHLLSRIPVGIIMREMTCLYGNLAFLNSQFKS